METQKPEKRTRVVKKLGYRVIDENTGPRSSEDRSPMCAAWDNIFETSKIAEDAIISNGKEKHNYWIVRVQKGPLRLSKVTKLE